MVTKKHKVTEVLVGFSGGVNAAEAQATGEYSLIMAGKRGSFTAKNARHIKLKAAAYDAATNTVVLIPRKPFALTNKVQLVVDGAPPSGLEDKLGRLIDGNRNGQAGSNAVAILSRHGVSIVGPASGIPAPTPVTPIVIDALLELDALAGVTTTRRARP
jgi:hypothetical protein